MLGEGYFTEVVYLNMKDERFRQDLLNEAFQEAISIRDSKLHKVLA